MNENTQITPKRPDPLSQVGWFTWTSPVGVGIGLMSVGAFFTLITLGIRILAETPY